MSGMRERATDVFDGPSANPRELAKQLREISVTLRRFGIGVQADFLDRLAVQLDAMSFAGVLASLEHPKAIHTERTVFYLAGQLMAAATLLRDLVADAEITGSTDAVARVRAWFQGLDLTLDS